MKEKTTQNNNNFLKKNPSDVTQHHKDYLGAVIPEDYFSKSKSSILNQIKSENTDEEFLKENFSDVTNHHQEYLGATIPENYFSKSKSSILQKINEDDSENKFLKENTSNVSQYHKDYLGAAIPEKYFAKSKLSILDKIKEEVKIEQETPKKQIVFYMRPQFKYVVAAALVFILSLTVWLQNLNIKDNANSIKLESLAFEDDVLIESLLVDDEDIDAFADATLFNEVMVKAELKEQKIDNLILDSLILEDSLLDDYMDEKFFETIIL
jgi:hypothetical protein